MAPERLVLDTDVIIDLLKKKPQTVSQFLVLVDAKTSLLISPIVVAEVYAGAFPREHKDVEAFFSLCQRVGLDADTGRAAGLYANQFSKAFQGISLEDYPLPIYDGDLQAKSGLPKHAVNLKRMMSAHHGVLIVTPEYNSSVPALVKNTID